jgi:hypothetical protein
MLEKMPVCRGCCNIPQKKHSGASCICQNCSQGLLKQLVVCSGFSSSAAAWQP